MKNLKNIAMLIDADNTQLSKLESVIQEISTNGRIVVKRAYGNWRKGSLKNWENELKRLAIKAEQQFDHSGIYDAFVIVASDSDYTPLAIKLRESGVFVMGVGEKKTPEPFRNACDEFVYLENLSKDTDTQTAAVQKQSGSTKQNAQGTAEERRKAKEAKELKGIHKLLRIAWDKYQDDDGYVNVSSAGQYIKRAKPDFDARTYGYVKLPELIEAFPKRYSMKRYPGKGTVTIIAYKCL